MYFSRLGYLQILQLTWLMFPEPYNAHTIIESTSWRFCYTERQNKAPAVHSWVFLSPFLFTVFRDGKLCFPFPFQYEAVYSQLEGSSLLSLWSNTIKRGKISGNWKWTDKWLVSLAYCVLIEHSSLVLSLLSLSLLFLNFLLCLGMSLLIPSAKGPSIVILHKLHEKTLSSVMGLVGS